MPVRAVLRDGRTVTALPDKHGETIESLVASVTEDSLTGSAVPLDGAVLHTDVGEIPYADVNTFAEDADFVP